MSDLYIIVKSDSSFVKIGRSDYPSKRAKNVQATQPFWATVSATFPQQGHHEKAVHKALEWRQVPGAGKEWFDSTVEEATETILAIIEQDAVNIVSLHLIVGQT